VLENLIENAAKYAPRSTVTISTQMEGDQALISVADDGPGIADEHVQNIFKRFYRVAASSAGVRGTGLGLFIVQQILNAHGGEIRVSSQVGKGTTFDVLLPVSKR